MRSGRRRITVRLSGDYPTLALSELLSLLSLLSVGYERIKLKGNYLTLAVEDCGGAGEWAERAGLTKAVGAEEKPLKGTISAEVWRVKKEVGVEEARGRIRDLKENLKRADVRIRLTGEGRGGWAIYMDEEETILLKIAGRRDDAILLRSNTYRPFKKPISIDPRVARAAVNLLKIPPGGVFLDPFCGTGGIALEAGLLGYRVFLADADPEMVEGSIINLKHFGINVEFRTASPVSKLSGLLPTKVDGIATDPPYGRASKIVGKPLNDLFLVLPAILKRGGKVLLVLHREDDVNSIGDHFNIIEIHSKRIHGSLTRYFALFEME
ncbi:MAG: RsmD family RNA methyltransferase, partial [Thermoplasmata archaeon]|nr:RsmD family RNA methyltransferase [Thermoplasmata archaeon]